jgi:hypothetical protein
MKRVYRIGSGILIFASFCLAAGRSISSGARISRGFPAGGEQAPSEPGPVSRFPFVFDGRVLVPVKVNDSPPLNIILDSGFNSPILLLMHEETGDELGLTYVRTVPGIRGAGSGANKNVHLTSGERVGLPGIEGKAIVAVMDENRGESLQPNVGVIGSAVLVHYVVKIDFGNSQVSAYDPATFAPPSGWEEIPLTLERNMPVLETTIQIGAGEAIPVKLIVDTGGKPALALAVNAERGIEPPPRTVRFLSGTGFRGEVFADLGRLTSLKIGGHVLQNVVSAFWTGTEAPFVTEMGIDGSLGLGTLYRFDMIFDYEHRRMFIKPNGHYSDPFEVNMAGIALEETVSGDTAVSYVMPGSEAEAKGIQKGDVLVDAGGKKTSDYGFLELKRLFESDGKAVRIKILRNGQVREVELSLKRII